MKYTLFLCLFFITSTIYAQIATTSLRKAIVDFENSPVMRHGIVAMTVMDSRTGKTVFNYNSEKGLAPASTQKIITSILAYELLGNNFQYTTTFNYFDKQHILQIIAGGDPTLGSERFSTTVAQRDSILSFISNNLNNNYRHTISIETPWLLNESLNEGWIWQDLGNYYGAAAFPLNWRENKFDIFLNTQQRETSIATTLPEFIKKTIALQNNCIADAQTSSDNSIIFYDLTMQKRMIINGSLPTMKDNFKISASYNFNDYLLAEATNGKINTENILYNYNIPGNDKPSTSLQITSPTLDTMQFYFLHESINLYGDALLKTMAAKESKVGSYENGIRLIHDFCKKINIDTASVHVFDGCGLSPQNRVTTKALCSFMQYAKSQKWFGNFFTALPIINNTRMKSGSIHQARAYTGFVDGSNGAKYTFAIIANGYDGKGKPIQQELWRIIDLLKK